MSRNAILWTSCAAIAVVLVVVVAVLGFGQHAAQERRADAVERCVSMILAEHPNDSSITVREFCEEHTD